MLVELCLQDVLSTDEQDFTDVCYALESRFLAMIGNILLLRIGEEGCAEQYHFQSFKIIDHSIVRFVAKIILDHLRSLTKKQYKI